MWCIQTWERVTWLMFLLMLFIILSIIIISGSHSESLMTCFTEEGIALQSKCSFMSLFIHSCVFRWVYVGQPYFQVSFNESPAYLGHFPLKLNVHRGIVSSPWNELLPALCSGFSRMFLCFNLLGDTPYHFVIIFHSLPFMAPNLWTAFLGITHQYQDATNLLVRSRLSGGLGTYYLYWRTQGKFLASNSKQTHLRAMTHICLVLEIYNAKSQILLFFETVSPWKPLLACPGRPLFHSD